MDIKNISTEVLITELNRRKDLLQFKRQETVPIRIAVDNGLAEICQYLSKDTVLSMDQFRNIFLFLLYWQRHIDFHGFISFRIRKLGKCPAADLLCYYLAGKDKATQKLVVYLDCMCNICYYRSDNKLLNKLILQRVMNEEDIAFFLNEK